MKEGDGSVLDRSMILYGAGISDSNRHLHDKLPVAVVGGGLGASKTGRHVSCSSDVPVTNLLLTLMNQMDVRPERLGDSTGPLVL
jgi:hypothetical protein